MTRTITVAVFLAGLAAPAAAQPFPVVSDRDYGIDLYQGAALGNLRIVGMGGAAAATAEGSAGTLSNPAAPAVRPATSTASWDWDWHVDYLSSVRSSDWDNNGIAGGTGSGVGAVTFGLAGMLQSWGIAVVGLQNTVDFRYDNATPMDPADDVPLRANTLTAKLALARTFLTEQITAGLALRVGNFELRNRDEAVGDRQLFSITGSGLEAGVVWRPYLRDVRGGVAIALPVTGTNVDVADCDPMSCHGYILPERVEVPWQLTLGGAYRLGPTEWNQWVGGSWRDEPSLTVAADVVITGSSPDAYGLERFAYHELQRSGRDVVLSLRGGAEYEWLPGRLRVRGGAYWEPGRFIGVGGRIHATFGLDLRVFQFQLWGRHRGRLSATGDIASRYTNIGVSVGFWH